MAASMPPVAEGRARFLFRNEEGVIDAPTWRFHAGWLLALALALTALWLVLKPFTHHDLATSAFIAPMTVLAFAYLVAYSFALLLIAVCYVMLTIKRLRDRAAPPALAALVPLLLLFAAALHFMHAEAPDVILTAYVVVLDIALIAAVTWTVVDLGFGQGRRATDR